ncbi:hypothetical protein [Arabidopsis thaliana]|uniref:Uncharacterized protein AT4g29070 n=1 Tax=Arabidopsis thaliana TaxID=3702 RepID=Q9SZD7_ARATH|nr:hypothetical protein [Arabidopsis thaliana]CAB79665.1 hypothetical protein [Arabidopsis thaliana]
MQKLIRIILLCYFRDPIYSSLLVNSRMNFGLPSISWFGSISTKKDVAMIDSVTPTTTSLLEQPEQEKATTFLLKQPEKEKGLFDIKIWTWSSFSSVLPWSANASDGKQKPTTINRGLKRHALSRRSSRSNGVNTVYRFRPYVSKVPWHTGTRAFLSQLFPRYGHYCGPNWSSGKDGGSMVWDQRPIDWLDHCCYCHDIGYDTHDQAELLKADMAFLECLESNKRVVTRGDAQVAHFYKTMCITDTIRAKSTRLWLDSEQPQQEKLEFSEKLRHKEVYRRYSVIPVSLCGCLHFRFVHRSHKERNLRIRFFSSIDIYV